MAKAERYQQYELLRREDGSLWELGRGAMGITYKAFDTNLRCTVALKMINSAFIESNAARQRFLQEARAAAALRHPNVASVFNLGIEQDKYFYIMEFIDGETVEDCVKRKGCFRPVEGLNIALQVACALAAAARERLVHRDLKPANLMLANQEREPTVKVIDFGLAKREGAAGEDSSALTMGGFVGTPHYASPEQVEGGDLDIRSDIYSLGATLYFMVTGHPPFSGAVGQVMSQHISRPAPKEGLVNCPPACVDLILQMMEKKPDKRPQTPIELRDKIQNCLQEIQPGRAVELVHSQNYRVDQIVSDHAVGKYCCGFDMDRRLTVGLLILSDQFMADPMRLAHFKQAVDRVRSSPHPGLRQILGFRTIAGQTVLVDEFTVAPSLLDVLRAQGPLLPADVVAVVKGLASVVTHASTHRLDNVKLTLSGVQLCDPAQGSDTADLKAWAHKQLTQWPELTVKVAPIDFDFACQPIDLSGVAGVTLPQGISSLKPRGSYVREIGLLAYELLDGPRATSESQGRYIPVPALSEEGNRVLRRAVVDEIGTAEDFARSLAACVSESSGGRRNSWVVNRTSSDSQFLKKREPKPSWWRRLGRLATVLAVAGILGYGFSHFLRPTPTPTTPTPTPTPDKFDEERAEIDQFVRAGNWQSAVTSCLDLVERYPSRDEPRQKLTTLLEEAQNKPIRINDENFSVLKPTLERAARLGVIPGMFLLAQHLQAKDPDAALSWYEQLAARGNRGAMVQAGLLYSNHHNSEDNRKALDYFIKAADAGDPAGKFYAGEWLYNPKPGLLRDEERALKYLREAEALGEPRSMNLLGMHYRKLHRYGEARHFFEEGVQAGSAAAMANLGLMYMNGEQITQDSKKAAELFRQAAELGDDSGMYNYGLCFFYGRVDGRETPQDLPEAKYWFRKAARAGNPDAIDYCSRHGINYR
jgi:serine/threonine protein kinase/TPR repeat protein